MLRRVWQRIAQPFREQPVRMGLVLIAVGMIDVVLRDGFGFEPIARNSNWLSDVPILILGAGLVLYGRLRRRPGSGALSLLLLLFLLS